MVNIDDKLAQDVELRNACPNCDCWARQHGCLECGTSMSRGECSDGLGICEECRSQL